MSVLRSKSVEIELLGGIQVRIEGAPVAAFPYDKVRALFALLVVEREQSLRREWLASLLWPRLAVQDGRRNLRIALTHLNKLLNRPGHAPLLVADRLYLRFVPGTTAHADIDFVAQAPTVCGGPVDADTMAEALRRYRGPFLGDLALPDNAEFDEWAIAQRETCQRRAIAIAEGLAAHFSAQGAIDRALQYAERACALDRHNELGHQRLIELLAASGRPVAARAQHQAYVRMLAEQTGDLPQASAFASPHPAPVASASAGAGALSTWAGAQRRPVTVLHIDILCPPDDSGIPTDFDTSTDFDDVAVRLMASHRQALETVQRHGGHGLSLGTGVLAYFGFPQARERCACDALQAARAVLDGAATRGIVVRCGLHSGIILAGDATRPDALGHCTRIASELCRHADAGEIVLSAAAHSLCGTESPCPPSVLEINAPTGHALQAWPVFRITREADGARQRAAPPARVFVGRDQELARLTELLAEHSAGEAPGKDDGHAGGNHATGAPRIRTALVRGEAGVGKSCLLSRFSAGLRAQGAAVFEVCCDPRHAATPYFPLIRFANQLLGLDEATDLHDRHARLRAFLSIHGPWEADAEPLLAYLLGLAGAEEAVLNRPAQQLRDALDRLLLTLLAQGMSHPARVLVMEDVHWADPSTLALVGRLLDEPTGPATTLLLTARPEFIVPWEALPVVELGPLPTHHTEALVAACLDASAVTDGVVTRIVAASDGVPLFAEEMARMVVAGCPWGTIPPTLQDVLAARLERVGEARPVAALAATIGRAFSHRLLAAAWPGDAAQLPTALAHLCASGLVESGDRPGDYRFKHALVQEAAYQMQSGRARQQAHAGVVNALRGVFAAWVANEPALLAHHLSGAGQPREAIECWLRAARSALARAANEEAVAHAEAGLSLIVQLPEPTQASAALTLRIEQGIALLATTGYGSREAAEAFTQAQALLSRQTGAAERFRVLWGVWMGSSSQHGYRAALELARTLHQIAGDLDRPAFLAASHYALGNNLLWLGRFVEAQAHFEAATGLVDEFSHREAVLLFGEDPVVTSLAFLAWTHWFRGNPLAAVSTCEQALEAGRRLGHPHSLSFALTMAAVLHRLLDDPTRVAALSVELLALADTRRLALWAATGALLQGWALARNNDEAGLALIQRALESVHNTMVAVRVPFLAILAESDMALNRHESALIALDMAEHAVEALADFHFAAELARLRAQCLAACDAPLSQVLHHLQRAVDIALEQSAPQLALRALNDLIAYAPPQLATDWHARRAVLLAEHGLRSMPDY